MLEPRRVMIVEDNAADLILFERIVRSAERPVDLVTERDGATALTYLGRCDDGELPHLIVLDLNLPRLSGIEVLEVIRADHRLAATPVIMLTTSRSEADVQRAHRSGISAFVCKDFEFTASERTLTALRDFWIDAALYPTRLVP